MTSPPAPQSPFNNVLMLPIANIQPDFQNVVSDVRDGTVIAEDVWLSCYKTGAPSVHGKVRVELGERRELLYSEKGARAVEFQSRDGVVLEKGEKGTYLASCEELRIQQTPIRVPRYVVRDADNNLKSKRINTVAVASDLSQIALGYENGPIRRLPLSLSADHSPLSADASSHQGEQLANPLTYTPHLSGTAIESLAYFPSSRVLLSGGADFTLHILDADPSLPSPPKPVRSLKGHIRPVTGIVIIGRGRNVLSGAKDGTVRLWDVPSGKQIKVMGSTKYAPVNALALGSNSLSSRQFQANGDGDEINNQALPTSVLDPREVGTADKRVFLALQNGDFECLDLGSKSSVFHSSSMQNYERHGAVSSIALDSDSSLLATGSSSGVVTIFDTRLLGTPLCAFQRNSASITGLGFVLPSGSSNTPGGAEPELAVATSDGLPYVAGIRPNGPEVRAELACGGDCEPMRALAVDPRGGIWLAGDEGIARMY